MKFAIRAERDLAAAAVKQVATTAPAVLDAETAWRLPG